MNIDYGQFYRETTNIPSYGNGTYKKDTLVSKVLGRILDASGDSFSFFVSLI